MNNPISAKRLTLVLALSFVWMVPAHAQDASSTRTRVTLGPQLLPKFPGSDGYSLAPFIDLARARGDDDFRFQAPDESASLPILNTRGLMAGPVVGFQGSRKSKDVGGLAKVGFTVEPGGFVQYTFRESFRLRGELRKGIGGHKGLIGNVGADYILRDRDLWLVSIGPRVTIGDDRYHRAYFGVSPAEAVRTGLPAFDAGGGIQAVGLTAGALRQLSRRWGVAGFAKYDRLVDDSGRSPVVRAFGSRDQFSGGVALSYTFGARAE